MKLTGGEIIVKKLTAEGVPYILGIPGHGVLGLFDAIRKEEKQGNIKYIQVKHEQAATAIADGYFRVKKEPLAVFASIGPGTLNLGIGLGTAYADSTAFLAFCGDTHVHMSGVGVLQELERYKDSNILRSLEPLSKRVWRAESARQLSRIVGNAFREMTGGRKGPCVISLPMDVQSEYAEYGVTPSSAEPSFSPSADIEAVKKAVALMKTAKRPVILAGGGAMNSGAGELIVKLAEKWGAGIITTLAAKGTVAETHPQYCFHTGSKGTMIGLEIASKADVILALGTRFADETTCSYRKGVAFNFPDTKLIQVDIDAHELGKNYKADIGIIANAKDAAEKILENFGDFEVNKAYLEEIKELRKKWFDYVESNRKGGTRKLTISKMIGVMNNELPDDTIIATSSGNTQAQLFQEYCYKKPDCNLTTGGFSTMGWAFPAAMGAKLAAPDRPVVALVGDGDFMMVMQELSTMAQYNIPIIVVVADNSGWMAIKDLQIDVLGSEAAFGNDFEQNGKKYDPDFAEIASAFHIKSFKAESKEGFKAALKDALEVTKAGKPAFIHAVVSNEYPYSGGKAFGWWDVPVPAYMEDKRANYVGGISEETV
ncbi:MAG: thiamine pyrophosphate-binding protein [Clostridia bacterium]|nr:thiamine pyrophosphate-binding protein [Clostridia bacterium]